MHGSFSSESVEAFFQLMRESGHDVQDASSKEGLQDFSSQGAYGKDIWKVGVTDFGEERGEYIENYDYTRCVRPDGSAYGTGGKCKKGTEQAGSFDSDGGVTTGASGGLISGSLFGAGSSRIATGVGKSRAQELVSMVSDKDGAFRKLLWPSTKLTKEHKKKLTDIKASLKEEAESLRDKWNKLTEEEKGGFMGMGKKDHSQEKEQIRSQIRTLYEAASAVNKKLKQPAKQQTRELKPGEVVGNFAETSTLDYTRCVRPDGSAYGTSGQCRKGTQAEKEEAEAIDQLASMLPRGEKILSSSGKVHVAGQKKEKSLDDQIREAYAMEQKARQEGNLEEATKHMRTHIKLANQLNALEDKRKEEKKVKGQKLELLKSRLMELMDKMDNAATIQQQQRLSSAVSELQKRISSGNF